MKFLKFLPFAIFLFGCSKNNLSGKLISQDTIVEIISDIHLGDAILLNPGIQSKPFKVNSEKYYNAILAKHNVTKEQFEENIKYYTSDTAKMKSIYDNVIKNLSIKQSTFEMPVIKESK